MFWFIGDISLLRNSAGLSRLLDGFPEGMLAQPFYGWVKHRCLLLARFSGLTWIASALNLEKDAQAPF